MQDILLITWYVILVILGVNALIIVHEFGHFIVARMCGVRCDKFYIWFDIYGLRFFRFKWGDTEYGLGVLPLGGYVKMFGQEDNPGQIAKEIEKAKAVSLAQNGENAAENLPTEEELKYMETALYAKDSYLSKSVPQRMAIISAGVIMNIVFAFICATGAYMIGFKELPCAIGAIVPGSPAWTAGLQIGDRIVEADGKKVTLFSQIMDALVDGDSEKGVRLTIERPGEAEPIEKTVTASQVEGALVPTIGIGNLSVTKLRKEVPLSKSLKEKLPKEIASSLGSGDQLVAIGGETVTNFADIVRIQETSLDKPLEYQFQKGNDAAKTITVNVAAVPMKELGLRFQMGEITTVKKGSAAEQAGIVPGDTLVEVGDLGPLDPVKLPQILDKKAVSAEETQTVSVGIRKKGSETVEHFDLPLVVYHENLFTSSPSDNVACSALGIAYKLENIIVGFDSAISSVEESKIPVGAVIESVEFPDFVPDGLSQASFVRLQTKWYFWRTGFQLLEVGKKVQLPFVLDTFVQMAPLGTKVRLHTSFEGKKDIYDFTVQESKDWFSANRGFNFAPEEFLSKAETFGEAARLGLDKTVYGTLAVYRFLTNIGGKVSAKAMGGPVTIVSIAYKIASQGLGPYLIFLCIIGANLAVLNILPIPVLDGGHLVFLTYEAIFRKPPHEGIQIGLSYIGLILLLGMMVWAISLDVGLISRF